MCQFEDRESITWLFSMLPPIHSAMLCLGLPMPSICTDVHSNTSFNLHHISVLRKVMTSLGKKSGTYYTKHGLEYFNRQFEIFNLMGQQFEYLEQGWLSIGVREYTSNCTWPPTLWYKRFIVNPLPHSHDAMHVSPESKKTIAFIQANSESSTCTSRNGRTTSSNILFAIRLMSDSCATLGITQSLPSNSTSLSGSERRARPSRRCSPACARSSATYETIFLSVNGFKEYSAHDTQCET